MYALEGMTGDLLWSRHLPPGELASAPTVAGGIVYEVAGGPTDGFLYALDSTTGSPLWKQPIADSAGPSPVVSGGNVYVVSLAVLPTVGAFDATSGAPIWSFIPSRTGVLSGPAIAAGVLYTAGGDRVYALDAATGEKVWTATTHFAEANPPAIANGVLYLALVGDTFDKVKELGGYANSVLAGVREFFEDLPNAEGQDLVVHVRLEGGSSALVNLALRGGPGATPLEEAIGQALTGRLSSIPSPDVRGGPVELEVLLTVWGGSGLTFRGPAPASS